MWFKWWVDFSNDPQEQQKVSRAIGLGKLNGRDLVGYGFGLNQLHAPVHLIDTERRQEETLQPGTEVLTFYLFVDTGAFYFDAVKKILHNYFAPRIAEFSIKNSISILRIKTIRMVKVGYVVVGYFDEGYIINDEYWRDKKNAYYPVIMNYSRGLDTKSMISSGDLE